VPESKIEVIYNWCDEQNIREVPRDKALAKQLGMDDCFNVVFAGTMGAVQALDVVLDAAMLLSDRNPDVQFVFVGGGIEVARLSKSARERRLQNVKFLPRRSFSEISSILALADALLVHIKDDPLFEITVPSKIQAYLAAGRPIIAALRGDGAELVQRANAGLGCDPCVPEKLAEVVLSLAHKSVEEREKMGQRGKQFYKENLALSIGVSHFEALFRSVAKTHI
jgi:glycosyltransferase involved in cell wall biosynthesis